jgi:hypothetical protein
MSNKPQILKTLLLSSIFLLSISAFAETSPLCDDLANLTCAPGSYDDGTGVVKSGPEVSQFLNSYTEKSKAELRARIENTLNKPDSSYFKDLAMAGFGLKDSPQCTSSLQKDISTCHENLVDALATLAQNQALGDLMPHTELERRGGLKDLSFLIQDHTYTKIINDFSEQAQKDLNSPEAAKKIQEKTFPQVKELLVNRLNQLSIPDDQKKVMISKINSISYQGSNCAEIAGVGGSVVSPLLVPNAFYDAKTNTFKFCSGFLLQSTSEFQIAFIVAHELGHSIDPCYVGVGPDGLGFKYSQTKDTKEMEKEYPIKNIIQCLRDDRSIGAINLNAMFQEKFPNQQMPTNPYASTDALPSFCQQDQITESVADWIGAEVISDYISKNYKLSTDQARNGYSNIFRLSCTSPIGGGMMFPTVHPQLEKRINKIILANPQVRSQMGCPRKPAKTVYCDPSKPLPNAKDAKMGGDKEIDDKVKSKSQKGVK